jgi:hypothetical protein
LINDLDNYEGQVDSQGRKHGLGRIVYTGSSMYEGEWFLNYQSGWGRIIYSGGDWYEGMFNYGQRNGRGVYTSKNGLKKTSGIWENDLWKYY